MISTDLWCDRDKLSRMSKYLRRAKNLLRNRRRSSAKSVWLNVNLTFLSLAPDLDLSRVI